MSNRNNNFAFGKACYNGDLEEAQRIFKANRDINISDHQEYAFRTACLRGHLEVARWLYTLRPYLYEVTDDGHCRVLTPEEQEEARKRYNITNTTKIGLVYNNKLRQAIPELTRYTSEFLHVKGKGGKRKTKRRRRNTKRSKK